MRKTGHYQKMGDLNYFIPDSLPTANPPFQLTNEIVSLYGQANFALGNLNEMGIKLPDPHRFIKAYVIKEAQLSSAIEGIATTIIELFTHMVDDAKPDKNTQLVLNYTNALDAALTMLRDQNLPLATRVILRAHEVLMSTGDGEKATPGHFRKQSVRVGALVPPPAPELPKLMADLEKYMHEASDLPPLIKAGLVHVQFETIHPFLDGNGRIGRLLIVLMLIESGLLHAPILYPSYYFKKNQLEYYQKLDRVRTQGDAEGWIVYYLTIIRDSAIDAYRRAQEIEALETELNELIQTDSRFVRIRETAAAALNFLFSQPITSIAHMSDELDKAYNTIQNILHLFVETGIVTQRIVNKRNKLYHFAPYLALLEKEYA